MLVACGGPGTYELNALPFRSGSRWPTGPLARVVVAGEPLPMTLPAALPTAARRSATARSPAGAPWSCGATSPRTMPRPLAEFTFTVDGKIFDASRINQRDTARRGEEWTIRNAHEHDDHMFHIHTNPFQVVEVSGQPQADRWRDTVSRTTAPKAAAWSYRHASSTTPRLHARFHMMNHQEIGMMQAVEVYRS